MLLIVSDNTDVYFNLAAEEYMLHEFAEDVLMLWRSRKAVVCGKHQNLCAEVNYGYCREQNIDIARRLSGGGTVYHDEGNVNFTFIKTIGEGLEYAVDYRRFLEPIRAALLSQGIKTEYSSRNDLLLNGKKISGNAEHVLQKKKRVLHHGTLLYSSHLGTLGKTLRPSGVYTDKAVKSVRSEVTNIIEHLNHPQDTQIFIQNLADYFEAEKHTNRYVLNSADVNDIEKLREGKYSREDWILAYSPAYEVQKSILFEGRTYSLKMQVGKGIIKDISLHSDADYEIDQARLSDYIQQPLNELTSRKFAEDFFASEAEHHPYCLF